jgi:hypothetical protein
MADFGCKSWRKNGFAALVCLYSMATAIGSSAETATVLKQKSQISGRQVVCFSKTALKIDNANTNATIFCAAPDWEVFIYNNHTHACFRTKAENFKADFFRSLTFIEGENVGRLPWRKTGEANVFGVPIIKYTVHLSRAEANAVRLRTIPVNQGEYQVVNGTALPAQVCNILAKLNGLPVMSALPFALNYRGIDGRVDWSLKTESAQSVPVTTSTFARPVGARPVKKENEVFMGEGGLSVVEELWGPAPKKGQR